MRTKQPKVALVHDWLINYRGGEKVLEHLCRLFPNAEIFTLFHEPYAAGEIIEKHRIHASCLNSLPNVKNYYRHLLPLFPLTVEHFDLRGFDLVISSSHCVAKGVMVDPDATHLCYCHTPMRYAWDQRHAYFGTGKKHALFHPILHYLRMWDLSSNARVDRFIANSHWVKMRINKYYRREACVIHPPVDPYFLKTPLRDPKDYYLIVSAFAPYKRLDLAIETCTQLRKKLIVVGGGQETKKLQQLKSSYVNFLGKVPQKQLRELYAQAKALLFPGEEDFGITPLESMACGRPVIAYRRGGVTESVIDGKTGLFFDEPTPSSLSRAIAKFESNEGQFLGETCKERARAFGPTHFLKRFSKLLDSAPNTSLITKTETILP